MFRTSLWSQWRGLVDELEEVDEALLLQQAHQRGLEALHVRRRHLTAAAGVRRRLVETSLLSRAGENKKNIQRICEEQ